MTKLQMTVSKNKSGFESKRYSLTIPQDIVKKKKWDKGQELFLTFNEKGNVVIEEF